MELFYNIITAIAVTQVLIILFLLFKSSKLKATTNALISQKTMNSDDVNHDTMELKSILNQTKPELRTLHDLRTYKRRLNKHLHTLDYISKLEYGDINITSINEPNMNDLIKLKKQVYNEVMTNAKFVRQYDVKSA